MKTAGSRAECHSEGCSYPRLWPFVVPPLSLLSYKFSIVKLDHFKLFKYKQIFLKNSNGFAMDFHSFRGKIRFEIFLIAGNININLIPICFAHRASKMAEEGERKE